MSAQVWMVIGIAGFSLAGVLLCVAVLLFVRWRIPSVVSELTGRTEKKQIEQMRQKKTEAANKVHFVPPAYEREHFAAGREKTGRLSTRPAAGTDLLADQPQEAGTEVLQATEVLVRPDENATVILNETTKALQPPRPAQPVSEAAFHIEKSVVVVHTGEVIG